MASSSFPGETSVPPVPFGERDLTQFCSSPSCLNLVWHEWLSNKNDNFSEQPSVTNCDELLYNFVYDDPPTSKVDGQLEPLPQLELLILQMEEP